jgi:pyrroline-5-carboxylate reductase
MATGATRRGCGKCRVERLRAMRAPTITCGIIGVGHLIQHMMPGLLKADARFLLSARNREVATGLAGSHGLEIVEANQEIVDRSDLVILAVRPFHAVEAVRPLRFRSDHIVLSFCAGVPASALAPVVAPARLVMAMPVVAAAYGESPTLLFPDNPACRALLEPCGPVIALAEATQFAPASVIACYFGWVHELIGGMIDWTASQGLDRAAARLLVAQMTRAAATIIRERTDAAPAQLLAELATPRSFTLAGLEDLRRNHAFEAWPEAATRLAERLKGT